MNTDITFQYPPELFTLLIEAISVLNRGKKDMLLFFRGAGVTETMTADLAERLRIDKNSIGKREIAQTVLERLNVKGEPALRERREILKRVVEFTNFDTCWPDDQMKAKGYVASVRDVVNQKDSFTRMNQAREDERKARVSAADNAGRTKRERAAKIETAKSELYALFGASLTPQQRGKKMEAALNRLFAAFDLSVKEAFHLTGDLGAIVEQIDGVIELAGALYFVEMKWYKEPVGVADISQHLPRVIARAEARGLVISASDFTAPAIQVAREFLREKVLVLCHVNEIVTLLDREGDLAHFLKQKADAAVIHKNPYYRPLDQLHGNV
jgi:restriction system protein